MKYFLLCVAFLTSLTAFVFILPLSLNGRFSGQVSGNKNNANIKNVRVFFTSENKEKTMPLEEYIVGVVTAEMPANFDSEALMAQAVAARTYTVNMMNDKRKDGVHTNCDICTDYAHCQAYISKKEAFLKWGNNASDNYKKCKNAVDRTRGEIMLYNNEPIKAVFHSSSSGKTENSEDVWGGSVPYLLSVDSPGEEKCPNHTSSEEISINEFKKTVLSKYDVDFSKEIIGKSEYTKGGSVKFISIGGVNIPGTEIRKMFSLRSACFEAEVIDNKVLFNVIGNGHGVGMSQYGANYLAQHGYGYRQILKKYYSGVEFSKIK